jgi:hypothetical protein
MSEYQLRPEEIQARAFAAANEFANSEFKNEVSNPDIAASLEMRDKVAQAPVAPPLPTMEEEFSPQKAPIEQPNIPAIQSLGETQRSAQPQVKMENYWEVTGLPSGGIFYQGRKIMARPLNVLEVKMLASINETNVNHVINQVLDRVIRGVAVDELLVADKLYIVFWLRANTYKDDGYKVEFDCLRCGATSDYEFGLNMLNIEYIKEKYLALNEMSTPSGIKFKARYLNVKDENKVSDFLESYKGSEEFDEDVLSLANMIEEINGEKMSLLQKYSFFLSEKCTPSDYAYIESFVRHVDFGVDPIMQVKCTKCGGTSPVAISFRSDFFVPQYTFE